MGLDYASVSAINARAILVATNAFGTTGPYAHRLGFDGLGQALSGAVYMSGEPGAPRRASVQLGRLRHRNLRRRSARCSR